MDNFIEKLNSEFDVEAVYKKINDYSIEHKRGNGFTYLVEERFVQVLNEAQNISLHNIKEYHNWLTSNYDLVPKKFPNS